MPLYCNKSRRLCSLPTPGATLILYGSCARGEVGPDFDIDIWVLLDKDNITYDDPAGIGHPIYHIELEAAIIISPMIFSKKLWETKHKITPFYKNVTKEGVWL